MEHAKLRPSKCGGTIGTMAEPDASDASAGGPASNGSDSMSAEVERLRAQLSQTVSLLQLRNKQIERLTAAQGKLQEELDTKTVELRHKTVSKTKRRAPHREKQQARIDELTREVRGGGCGRCAAAGAMARAH